MDEIVINKIGLEEITALQIIGRQTFFETFADGNTEENMQKYLEEGFTIDKLTAELTNPDSAFYFATIAKNLIGYLKINFGSAQTELKENNAIEIERIYVLIEFHGKKVGQLLYEKALDIAKQKNAGYLWLGVWEKNLRAINFYKKNGFIEFDKHIFKLGDDNQTDIMMKLDL
ncbi:MAG: GNAT family N-acetyltransferase [Bacteroidota bacterium]